MFNGIQKQVIKAKTLKIKYIKHKLETLCQNENK
jgi:hypothetical protein